MAADELARKMGLRVGPSKAVTQVSRRTGPREEVVVVLAEGQLMLPLSSYPCPGGLKNLMYYKPNLVLLSRHEEWEPRDKPRHAMLVSNSVRRASCIGTLHERHKTLEGVHRQIMSENASLYGEIAMLRELLEGGAQQEEMLQTTLEREREMRKAAEREKALIVRAKEEAEEKCELAIQQVAQLQSLLHQAVEYHDSGHQQHQQHQQQYHQAAPQFYGYPQHA